MRHNKKTKVLDRKSDARGLLLRNLVTQLFLHEKIKTTSAKARVIKPLAEKIITKGKKKDLAALREIFKYVMKKEVAHKILNIISPRYLERKGGYTRIIKIGPRQGDGAEIVQIELV